MDSIWKTLSHTEEAQPGAESQPPDATPVLEAHLDSIARSALRQNENCLSDTETAC